MLETAGFRVFTGRHGLEGLAVLEMARPHLVVSDISMPKMDGYRFYEAVRARPQGVSVPFIFLTGRGDEDEIREGRRLGVDDYLVKPVREADLLVAVRARLERRRRAGSAPRRAGAGHQAHDPAHPEPRAPHAPHLPRGLRRAAQGAGAGAVGGEDPPERGRDPGRQPAPGPARRGPGPPRRPADRAPPAPPSSGSADASRTCRRCCTAWRRRTAHGRRAGGSAWPPRSRACSPR